ncbi:MAG: DUF2911 domain-containing protein [Cyclobacteriaceae bacterium]
MKKYLLPSFLAVTCMALLYIPATVQAQNVTQPRPVSPAAELKQTIGVSTITVNYSRPRVTNGGNNRTGKIWGQLVPYGFEATSFVDGRNIPWRAGANENTIITLSDDVKVEGRNLMAGSYGLHMAVNSNNTATIIFSKNTSSWGSFYYDEKEDALRVDVKTESTSPTELLTYDFVQMGNNYGVLAMSWEKLRIPIRFEFDVHEIVVQGFRDELRSIPGFGWRGLQQAAAYCVQNSVNYDEALTWIDRAINNTINFNTLNTKSQLLAKMGKANESQKMMDEAVETANMGQLNFLGYQMLGQKKYDKAIEYFALNAKRNPKNANCWDSLGEGYKLAGDKKNAIKNLKKSLSMNPPANVKANSIKLLKELGVEVEG